MSAFPLLALPKCVALRSKHDNSYLRSVYHESHGGNLVELGHGDGGVMNPRARFYLEASKEHEGLIHVRCCYNNKYWVPQQRVLPGASGNACWVIGTVDEPEDDLSKASCTLHKLITIDGEQAAENGSTTCRFLHSKLGKEYACAVSSTSLPSYMHIASDEYGGGGLIDTFTVIDVSYQKLLPSYLAFKGDNGRFLAGQEYQSAYYGTINTLQFSGKDIGDPRVLYTTYTNDDGIVRIKSNYFGKFWRNSINFVWGDSDDTTQNDPYTLFWVTTGDGFIAFRNLANNNFCKRLTNEWYTDCFNAAVGSITNEARLQYVEPVLSRDIFDVNFRLSEARMYTKGIDGLDSLTVTNNTSTTNKQMLTFTYTSRVETTWSSTVSVKLEVKTTLECGIPLVAEGKIEISTEFSGSYTWGKTESEEKQISKQIEVEVPPMKKVTVKGIGSNGVCDIPFSYKQRDVLINGQEVTQEFTDGMYYGVKTSSITFEVTEQDL